MEKNILIAGFGNTLMGDDGIGPRAVALLQQGNPPPEVELIDAGASALDLLPCLENKRLAVFIDAVRSGREPGAVVRLAGADLAPGRSEHFSLHTICLADAMSLWQLQIPVLPEIVVIGMEPARFELNLALSPAVEAALPLLCRAVLEEIDRRRQGADVL